MIFFLLVKETVTPTTLTQFGRKVIKNQQQDFTILRFGREMCYQVSL